MLRNYEIIIPLHGNLLSGDVERVEWVLRMIKANGYEEFDKDDRIKKCGQIINCILDQKIDFNMPADSDYPILLHFAICNQDDKSFDSLLKNNDININAKLSDFETSLLHVVALRGTLNMAKALLQRGADVNAKAKRGVTPLHLACGGGRYDFISRTILPTMAPAGINAEMVECLIEHGSDLEEKDEYPYLKTPLQLAIYNNAPKIIVLLLRHGANLNVLDSRNGSLLHLAVNCGAKNDIIEILLEKGMDPNARNENGETPIFHLIHGGLWFPPPVMKLLIRYGARLDVQDNNGNTPLHNVFEGPVSPIQSPQNLEDLLKYKPDINIRNRKGQTPLQTLQANYYSSFNIIGMKESLHAGLVIFCAHLAKLKACGEFVSEQNLDLLRNDTILKDIFESCESELNKMKMKKICDQYTVSYFDFLTRSIWKLTALARNKDMMKVLSSGKNEEMFPTYARHLRNLVIEVRLRESAYRRCGFLFQKVVEDFELELPHFIVDKILDYLSIEDLCNFGKSL